MDETGICLYEPEMNRPSMEGKNIYSQVKKKFQAHQSLKKDMLTVFWDLKEPLTIDFFEKGANIKSFCPRIYTCVRVHVIASIYKCIDINTHKETPTHFSLLNNNKRIIYIIIIINIIIIIIMSSRQYRYP